MSELEPAKPGRVRDAATLILLDRSAPKTLVLMGKRHAGHKFMPGKFVFPGGAVDPSDRLMGVAGGLGADVEKSLLARTGRPSPSFARALAMAALRETFEETGLALGMAGGETSAAPPEGAWARFAATGVAPALDGLDFLARAITPPGRSKRFDTRFFVANAGLVAHREQGVVHAQAELVELVWTPLDEALDLDIAAITRVVLKDLDAAIAAGMDRARRRPFYREAHGRWLRGSL